MTEPVTHQDLFDSYIDAQRSLIGEFSTSFISDWRELIAWAEVYASAHGLSDACVDELRADIADAEGAA